MGFDAADVDRIATGVPDPVNDAAIHEAARRLAAQDGNEKVEQYAFDSAISNVRVAQILQKATSGALDERGVAEATKVLEDLLIEMQPDLFDSLHRPSKLQVAQLTQQLFLADQPIEGEQDAVEATQEPSASSEAGPAKKTSVVSHDSQIDQVILDNGWGSLADPGTSTPQDADDDQNFAG